MAIEKCDKCGQEYEINENREEVADYLCPHNGRTEKVTGRKTLDEALRIIRHEVINMEQDRTIRKDVMKTMKEQIKDLEEIATAFHAGETNRARDWWWAYQCRHKGKHNDKG